MRAYCISLVISYFNEQGESWIRSGDETCKRSGSTEWRGMEVKQEIAKHIQVSDTVLSMTHNRSRSHPYILIFVRPPFTYNKMLVMSIGFQ